MGFSDIFDYHGLRLAELVKKKEIKPIELIEAAIERIERHNPQLNAVVFKAFDEARATAKTKLLVLSPAYRCFSRTSSEFRRAGRTGTAAASCRRYLRPRFHLVVRFQAAGLIPLGKTNVPEFGALPLTEFEALRARAQSLESQSFDRRLLRRIGCRRGGRHCAARARQ